MRDDGIPQVRRQKFRIVAQDPAVRLKGRILTAQVEVPAEELASGPWGHRVHVIDYDASTQTLYRPLKYIRQRFSRDIDGERKSAEKA